MYHIMVVTPRDVWIPSSVIVESPVLIASGHSESAVLVLVPADLVFEPADLVFGPADLVFGPADMVFGPADLVLVPAVG